MLAPTRWYICGAISPLVELISRRAETLTELGQLGNYQQTSIIGRGGKRVLFAAHNTKPNRTAAIKLVADIVVPGG